MRAIKDFLNEMFGGYEGFTRFLSGVLVGMALVIVLQVKFQVIAPFESPQPALGVEMNIAGYPENIGLNPPRSIIINYKGERVLVPEVREIVAGDELLILYSGSIGRSFERESVGPGWTIRY